MAKRGEHAASPRAATAAPGSDEGPSETALGILRSMRSVAVVGASDQPGRPSHRVTFYLIRAGFDVYPVNPNIKELGGRPAYPDLKSVPAHIDVVDIFRRPESVMPIVEEAIQVGAGAVWMQEGVINEQAAARARGAGLAVVMDRCIMKEHRRMLGRGP
ncbi:MAG: CoA-binding protein [Thermoplasmatota archaeon]